MFSFVRLVFLTSFFFCLTSFSLCYAQEEISLKAPELLEKERVLQTLSSVDKALYAEIFALVDAHEYKEAKKMLELVHDDVLKGHILAKIYLAPDTISTKTQLTNWLKKYYTQPQVKEVYDLAVRKKAYLPIRKPSDKQKYMSAGSCTSMPISDPIDLVFYKRASYVSPPNRKKVRWSMLLFSASIRNGKTLAAKLHLNEKYTKKYLSQRDRDDSLTALAFAYFIDLEDKKAWETIQEPLKRAQNRNPTAHWVAGLTAFRMGKWEEAEKAFKTLAAHPQAIATQKSAAAFWTTRLLLKAGKYEEIKPYLEQAAKEAPNFFYAILAQRALGWPVGHDWKSHSIEDVNVEKILENKSGKRIVALLEINQVELAEEEIIKLYVENKALRKKLVALAETIEEAPDLSMRLASMSGEIKTLDGKHELYPFPNWKPMNGWQIDKALVYGFVRQESCFKNRAFSNAGARGVMQIMPTTARLMARKLKQKYWLSRLHDISYNLMIGQELIKTLLNNKIIDGNLLMAIASYNCGTRNIFKWKKRKDFQNDPLMFVEAIPARETRGFVKKVTANYWVYRSLFGQDLSSVDDVLKGVYPNYKPDSF